MKMGDLVGERYRLIKEIGRGGMCAVYLAEDLDRSSKAVKILHPALSGRDDIQDRMREERNVLLRLQGSPYVIRYVDFGWCNDTPYLVTEYLREGRFLKELAPMHPSYAIDVFKQLALGLEFIHSCGIIHRDIKDANVFVRNNGEVVILDFGLSRNTLRSPRLTLSRLAVFGTPENMPPEQCVNTVNADEKADIFATGQMLYWALTKRHLFPRNITDTFRVAEKKLEPPDRPPVSGTVSDKLWQIIRATMRPVPTYRPTARELYHLLKACL